MNDKKIKKRIATTTQNEKQMKLNQMYTKTQYQYKRKGQEAWRELSKLMQPNTAEMIIGRLQTREELKN